MTAGFRTRNKNNQGITIDENLHAYAYLGAWPIPSQGDVYQDINFSCAGFPLVFFDVPYNVTAQEIGAEGTIERYMSRTGIAMVKLVSTGADAWRATFVVNNYNGPDLGLYMRVFGLVHLNHPNGGPGPAGLRIRNRTTSNLVFDSSLPMLRLGGPNFDTELALDWQVPGSAFEGQASNAYDSSVNVGTSMNGMSVAATSRGMVHWPFNIGTYVAYDDGRTWYVYDVHKFVTLYWASGNSLYARRVSIGSDRMDVPDGMSIDNSHVHVVYSRVSIINNAHWGAVSGGGGTTGFPRITTQPASTADLADGALASFTVVASGTGPLSYQWQKNNANIPGANSATYSFTTGTGDNTGDGYRCFVSNSLGEVVTLTATLTIHHGSGGGGTGGGTPAFIISNPSAQSVVEGDAVSFSIVAGGTPAPSYQWQQDYADLPGETSSTLSLTASLAMNGKSYRCFAINTVSGTYYSVPSSNATLTVSAAGTGGTPASITANPTSITATEGDVVNFSIGATGSPTPTYQWQKNNADIPGATSNSYSFVASLGDNGATFRCFAINTVSGTTYSAASSSATLTVNAASTSGEYPTYQDLVYQEDIEYDSMATYNVTATDPWHIGTGDSSLYDVMATPVGTSDALSGAGQQFNVWYSFADHPSVDWILMQPSSSLSGHSTASSFTVSIRLRSTGVVKSTGSGHLESINS